jgi:hypothetical protein
VTAARAAPATLFELRYERLVSEPATVAQELASAIDAPTEPLARALASAHPSSVGRHRSELSEEQLAEVEDEAGALLAELGYAAT